MPRRRRHVVWFAVLLLAGACTAGAPGAVRPTPAPPATSPSPSPSPTPTPTRTPAAPVRFDATRAAAHARHLAVRIGPREAGSEAYREAADYVARVFASLGYGVGRQRFPIPSGTSAGVPVEAGESQNVVAQPPGFDPASPHILAGAHLDTVSNSPGANDNGSGIGVLLELARLASLEPTPLPVVWVAFGAEERRRPGSGALYGSKHYLASMGGARRAALERVLNLDMVGNGARVRVCHSGKTPRSFIRHALAAASRLRIPATECRVSGAFSDYRPFEEAGYTIAWLWAGEHSTLHTARDNASVLQEAEIGRVGAVAWETLRSYSR